MSLKEVVEDFSDDEITTRLVLFRVNSDGTREEKVNRLVYYVELEEQLLTLHCNVLQERLKEFNAKISGVKQELVSRLIVYIDRDGPNAQFKNPNKVSVVPGDIFVVFKQRRIVFRVQPEPSWKDIDTILPTDNPVPPGYDIDVLYKFLKVSDTKLDDENFELKTKKPAVTGFKCYSSLNIKRAWFAFTDDNILLFRCNMAATMTADKR